MKITRNVTQLVGNAPLVRLNRLFAAISSSIARELAVVGVPPFGNRDLSTVLFQHLSA
jgi:hypothetical protein